MVGSSAGTGGAGGHAGVQTGPAVGGARGSNLQNLWEKTIRAHVVGPRTLW